MLWQKRAASFHRIKVSEIKSWRASTESVRGEERNTCKQFTVGVISGTELSRSFSVKKSCTS
jgi:hypothetical protein